MRFWGLDAKKKAGEKRGGGGLRARGGAPAGFAACLTPDRNVDPVAWRSSNLPAIPRDQNALPEDGSITSAGGGLDGDRATARGIGLRAKSTLCEQRGGGAYERNVHVLWRIGPLTGTGWRSAGHCSTRPSRWIDKRARVGGGLGWGNRRTGEERAQNQIYGR